MSRGAGTVAVPVAACPYPAPPAGGLTLIEQSTSTTVTAHATPHTKGSWTELIAATTEHADWVSVWISAAVGSAGVDTRALLDIGIGAAAAETAVVTELSVGSAAAGILFHLPVRVPKGSRLSARLQALVVSETVGIVAGIHSTQSARRSPSKLVTLNADTAASTSTTMMTVSNTWTEVTAATAQPFKALVAVPCPGVSAAWSNDTAEVLSVGAGASGAEVLGGISPVMTWANSETISVPAAAGSAILQAYSARPLPAGTRVATKITTGRAYKGAIVFGVPYS